MWCIWWHEKRPGRWPAVQGRNITAVSQSLQLICLWTEVNGPGTTNMCIKKFEVWSVKNARVLLCIANCPPMQNRKLGSHPVYKKHFSHSDALIIFSTFKLLSVPPTPSYWIIFTKTGAYYKAVGFCVIADTRIHFLLPVRKHSAYKSLLLEHILEVATVLLLAPIYDLIHSKPALECQLICQYEFKSTSPFECLSFLFPCFCIILNHSDRLLNISLLRRLQSLYTK